MKRRHYCMAMGILNIAKTVSNSAFSSIDRRCKISLLMSITWNLHNNNLKAEYADTMQIIDLQRINQHYAKMKYCNSALLKWQSNAFLTYILTYMVYEKNAEPRN